MKCRFDTLKSLIYSGNSFVYISNHESFSKVPSGCGDKQNIIMEDEVTNMVIMNFDYHTGCFSSLREL